MAIALRLVRSILSCATMVKRPGRGSRMRKETVSEGNYEEKRSEKDMDEQSQFQLDRDFSYTAEVQRILATEPLVAKALTEMRNIFCSTVVISKNMVNVSSTRQHIASRQASITNLRVHINALLAHGLSWDRIKQLSATSDDSFNKAWEDWMSLIHSEIDPYSWAGVSSSVQGPASLSSAPTTATALSVRGEVAALVEQRVLEEDWHEDGRPPRVSQKLSEDFHFMMRCLHTHLPSPKNKTRIADNEERFAQVYGMKFGQHAMKNKYCCDHEGELRLYHGWYALHTWLTQKIGEKDSFGWKGYSLSSDDIWNVCYLAIHDWQNGWRS